MSITFLFDFTEIRNEILIAYTKPYPICLPSFRRGRGGFFSLEMHPKIYTHLEWITPLRKGVACASGSTLNSKTVVFRICQITHPEVNMQRTKVCIGMST